MASYTEHYGLHQWEATDDFLRTDFNADHQLIDAALAGLEEDKAEIVVGSYVGNGASSRSISLGFRPRAVLLENNMGERKGFGFQDSHGGLALENGPLMGNGQEDDILYIQSTGFRVCNEGNYYLNSDNATYYYLALR